MSDAIKVDDTGAVWEITLDAPAKMNALDFAASDALTDVWRRFAADPAARVALVTGAGDRAFCAGADLKTYTMPYATMAAPKFRRTVTDGPGFAGITRGMEIHKPIVAAVNGFAVSGGLELALACDVRFCSPQAEFGFQDVRWGFHPCDGGCVRLPQIVGLGHAMELILSGRRIGAEEACRIGLVNRVVPAGDLMDEARAYAADLAKRAPLAQQAAKQVILESYGRAQEDALKLESRSFHDLGRSEDLAEGTTAFREKRQADFKGR
jgi:enoyl-CoA hydratase/carnithine racemase